MMIPKEGERMKYLRDGNIYEVRKITNDFVILKASDGLSQIMVGRKGFDLNFEEMPQILNPRKNISVDIQGQNVQLTKGAR